MYMQSFKVSLIVDLTAEFTNSPKQILMSSSSKLVEQACAAFPDVLLLDPEPHVAPVIDCAQDAFRSTADDQYYVRKMVGSGASGTALIGRRKRDNLGVIAKLIDLTGMEKRQLDRTRSEVQCLSKCNHSAIIQYLTHKENSDGRLLVVMELADAGDLGFQIKHRRETKAKFLEHEVALMFVQIVMAIDYVHSSSILHRDLKPANIFVKANGLVKLGDFGLSKVYEDTVSADVATSMVGTPYYLAPEVWRREPYSKKADMFSLGVLFFELLALERPFKGPNVVSVMQAITSGARGSLPENITKETAVVVDRLLSPSPEQRPTTMELLETPLMDHAMRVYKGIVNSLPANDATKAVILQDIKNVRAKLRERFNERYPRKKLTEEELSTIELAGPLVFLEDGKKWKQRQVHVGKAGIRIAKTAEGLASPLLVVPLADVHSVIDVPRCFADNRANAFALILQNDDALWFYTADENSVVQWISVLSKAIGI